MNHLIIPSSVTFGTHGLTIGSAITKAEFLAILEFVKRAENATLFYLSDLIRYGENQFGLEETAIALEQAQFDLTRITQASKLKVIDIELRENYALSSEHCYVLCQNCPENSRAHWAEVAYKEGLTAHELQKSIAAGTVMRKPQITSKAGTGTGIPLIGNVMFQYNRWLHHIGEEKILNLPKADIQKIIETFMPILELCAKLETKLPKKNEH